MIKLTNLMVGYYGSTITPFINGHIDKGNMVAVIGPNGSGKSTFLKTLAGFLPPTAGRLEFTEKIKPTIGYLPQKNSMDQQFPLTVFDVVSMGCWPSTNFFRKINKYQKYLILDSLKRVKLLNVLDKSINQLSDGQFQRMLFARILVQKSSLILLDEPFQGIDNIMCKIMIDSVQELCKCGCTALIVLHDSKLVNRCFSKILLLTRSCSAWNPSVEMLI